MSSIKTQKGRINERHQRGRRIQQARCYAELSLSDLAAGVGVSRYTLRKFELGESEPSCTQVIAIAHLCQCDVHWLIFGDDMPPKHADKFYRNFK